MRTPIIIGIHLQDQEIMDISTPEIDHIQIFLVVLRPNIEIQLQKVKPNP